ncbi:MULTISPECIES: 16S rRNA (cytosine(967)-C(5))-methyltransferase RsmB [Exiguobacterium]|uniref:16S rRNA (cytosine(967)-C(5))-methyltransferase RsmB n=1 Tax=Exiguobacterium TaxID=33986 RepID=UPI001BE66EB3|nr:MULTISPECIES: 16S rRNA (cytosine(967)-C(5))-methyltransferase RsmB [Exiguobacterium]MCT4782766.1 16S rRNA (cytosine(967)-C(5))-methyltransferase RsmB [Exiguobacterium himgiriensis]
MNVRQAALDTLIKIEQGGAYSTIAVNELLKQKKLAPKDVGLYTELVYGTLGRKRTLDYILEKRIQNPRKLDRFVLPLLRMSVYQLFYLDKVPDRAVLHEAVEIAKKRGHSGTGKFVNGVLRNVLRDGFPDLSTLPDVERIAIEHSHPEWLVADWIDMYGVEATETMCKLNNEPAPVTVRVNRKQTTVEAMMNRLADEGVLTSRSELSVDGLVIESGNVHATSFIEEGLLSVQDESSMLVADAIGVDANDDVLDACAAPGGKAMHTAERMDGGSLTALDLHPHKAKLIERQAKRLHIDGVTALALDARSAGDKFERESFDRILLDVPCSGLGVIRRKPDIKWTKDKAGLAGLPKVQREIIDAVLPLLKRGGTLVYSTCTIDPSENEQQADYILSNGLTWDDTLRERLPHAVRSMVPSDRAELKLLPTSFGTDGFYIAAFKKEV